MSPKKIPSIAHCFWYSPHGLPYLRYLSILSFAVHNPDFQLIVYTTQDLRVGRAFNTHEQSVVHITKDYTNDLSRLPNVTVMNLPEDFVKLVPFKLETAVHVSDILRIWLLSTVGGYWIDSDIIFTTSISNSFIGLSEFNNTDTILSLTSFGSICPYLTHRIGFLGACQSNKFFAHLMNRVVQHSSSEEYQAFGAALYNDSFPTVSSILGTYPDLNLLNLPNHALYSMQLTELLSERISSELFINNKHILGCHWYGGGDQLADLVDRLNKSLDVEAELDLLQKETPNFLIELFGYSHRLISFL